MRLLTDQMPRARLGAPPCWGTVAGSVIRRPRCMRISSRSLFTAGRTRHLTAVRCPVQQALQNQAVHSRAVSRSNRLGVSPTWAMPPARDGDSAPPRGESGQKQIDVCRRGGATLADPFPSLGEPPEGSSQLSALGVNATEVWCGWCR